MQHRAQTLGGPLYYCPLNFSFTFLFFALFLAQGIKFYDPEIVENTPEAVEYKGLQNVLDAVAEHLGYTQGQVCGNRHCCGWVCPLGEQALSCNLTCNTADFVCLILERVGHSFSG